MAKFRPKILKWDNNVVYTQDGSIWVNYITSGSPIDMYSPETITTAQRDHEFLFSSLVQVAEMSDVYIGAFLSTKTAQERLSNVVNGLPNFATEKRPELEKSARAHAAAVMSGVIDERVRVYWISVRFPSKMSPTSRLSAEIINTNPFENVSKKEVLAFNREVFNAIPSVFKPMATRPAHLFWVYDRIRFRGLTVPEMNVDTQKEGVIPSPKSFPQISIDKVAEGSSLVTDFSQKFINGDIKEGRDKLSTYFRSLFKSQAIGIRNIDNKTDSMPDGPISYQTVFAISGYATSTDYGIRGFTGIVDLATGLDGDFVLRLKSAPEMDSTETLNKTLKNLSSEDTANSGSVLDSAQYADKAHEVFEYSETLSDKGDNATSVPIAVTTIFAFGSPRLDVLKERTRSIISMFAEGHYRTYYPVGGQVKLWDMMFPCSALTKLGEDLHGITTARLLGAYIPLRTVNLGDGIGVPIGQCIENCLGTEIYIDMLGATKRGNGSIAFTGAMGKGKSHAMKLLVSWLSDLGCTSYILDGQGEWATYVTQFPSRQVIDLVNPTASIDLLKIIRKPDGTPDYSTAATMLEQLLLPLWGVRPDSSEGTYLRRCLTAEYMSIRDITTTRQLLESIVNNESVFELRDVLENIKTMLQTQSMTAFIDPVIDDRVQVLPPAKLTANNVVFYTHGLTLPLPGKATEDMTFPERYTIMANTAVALITAWRFKSIRNTTCAFVLDEASFYEDLDVLTQLIETPDRTGRKFGNLVIVGSQTGSELSKPEYKLIRRRICMGQDTESNAEEALEWAGFIASERLIADMVNNTSPLDSNNHNLPVEGRAGEAYMQDGTRKGKIRVYPVFRSDRRKLSDTSTGKFIRYEDLSSSTTASVSGAKSSKESS